MAKKEDTPNKGHKHLFGSSEKSDFILNMTADGAQKMCGVYIILAVIITALAAIPAYFTQTVEEYTLEDGSVHYLSENFIFYAGAAVMLLGFVGYLIFMIACSKKQVVLKDNKALFAPLAVMLLSAASCITSLNLYTAVLGYLGRHEGIITILGYFGLFAVAFAVHSANRKIRIMDLVVGTGFVQAAVGILQAVPATSSAMKNFFEYLYVGPGTDPSFYSLNDAAYYDGGISQITGIYTHSRAASGFVTSPFALAAVLAVAFACAAAGAAFDENKKRRVLYTIAAPVIAAAACLTRVKPAVIGIIAAAVIVLVLAVIGAVKKKERSAVVFAVIIMAVSGACGGILFGTGAADFRDEQVIFTDGFVMRSITYFGREDTEKDIYTYLRDDGMYVAQQNPMLGTGPDNLSYEYSACGTITDRFYNEYVDLAASRGIPCLIAYGIFLLVSVVKMAKGIKRFIGGETDWTVCAASAAVLCYLIQAFFNTSWVNSTLYLYIMLGLVWSGAGVLKSEKSKGSKK